MVLIFAYFCNNYEGFAGTVEAKNAEALAIVSSVYNKDNMTLTNLNVNNKINIPRNGKITYSSPDDPKYTIGWSNDNGIDGLQVKSWGGGEFNVFAPDDKSKRILWWNNGGVGTTDLYASKGIFSGGISGQTLNVVGTATSDHLNTNYDVNAGRNILAKGAIIADNITARGLPVSTSKLIYGSKNVGDYDQYYKDEIVKEYKQSDPNGKSITFFFVFKTGQGGGDPLPIDINKDDESLWVRSYLTMKQGNRVFIFFIRLIGATWQKDVTVKIPN